MEDQLIQQLKKFRTIKPDLAYEARLRTIIIVGAKPKQPFFAWPSFNFKWIMAGAAGVAVIALFLVGSLLPTGQGPQPLTALDSEYLIEEFDDFKIDIQLKEISYEQDINQAIASALSEISDSSRHLSPLLLESEGKELNIDNSSNPEIEELLNKVIF